jgi:BolA family transcriptional regulator, general stress-responsive regulator
MNSQQRSQRLAELLQAAFNPIQLTIRDDSHHHAGHASSGGGGHFHVTITAESFEGQSLVARHRQVYAAASELLSSNEIHALSIDAKTPREK